MMRPGRVPVLENLVLSALFRGDSLKARAARGSLWTAGGIAASQALRLGSNLVLTRLLFPEAFGMMAIVQVFLTGLTMFSTIGIRASLIQNDRSHNRVFRDTAWTLQIFRGVALWLITCAIAGPVAWFYEEDLLADLLPVAGLTALIAGFLPTRIHTANRDLLLGRITLLDLISQLGGIIVMIVLAYLLQSVWALVLGSVAGSILKLALTSLILPGPGDRFRLDRSSMRELISFGKWILISTACGFLMGNADRAILAKFIDLDLLGIYTIGLFLARVPLLIGQPLADRVLFPLYKQRPPAASAENREKLFRMRRLLTGGLLLLAAMLATGGDLLVQFLYDPRYALAGPILVLLSLANMPRIILLSYGMLLLAAGDSRRFMHLSVLGAVIQTTAMVIGIGFFGIAGAIVAPAITPMLLYPLTLSYAKQYTGWDWKHDALYGATVLVLMVFALTLNVEPVSAFIATSLNIPEH